MKNNLKICREKKRMTAREVSKKIWFEILWINRQNSIDHIVFVGMETKALRPVKI